MMVREYRVGVAALVGVALAAVTSTAGCASAGSSATTTSGSTRVSAQAATTPSSATLAGLTGLVRKEAAEDGAVPLSAVAVRSTRHAANLALGSEVATDPDEAVWAIVVVFKTSFGCRGCSVAPGAKPPQGRVVSLVVDATTLDTRDFGLGDEVPDLAVLGTPVPLPV